MKAGLFVLFAGSLALSGCDKTATDAWTYANDVNAPNVTRNGDSFMFTFAVISLAKKPVTKKVTLKFVYSQKEIDSKSNVSPSLPCDPAAKTDCTKTRTYTTTIDITTSGVGDRQTRTLVAGNPARPCNVSTHCDGRVFVSFGNDNGIAPVLDVSWKEAQNGNANDLTVIRTNPKG